MISNHSKSLLVILSLISTVLLAVLVLGVYDIRAKNKETSELLNLADHAAESATLAQSIRTIQNEAEQDLEAFDNIVLSSNKLVSLIEKIEGTGRELDLDTSIISVGKVEDKKSVVPDTIRIVLETQGPWAPTLSFLNAIESLPNRVLIDETSLSKGEANWRLRVVLSLYLFD